MLLITREEYIKRKKLLKDNKFHKKRLSIMANHRANKSYNEYLDNYYWQKHLKRQKRSFTKWGKIENLGYDIRVLIYLVLIALLVFGILAMLTLLLNDLNRTSICIIVIVLLLIYKLYNETR